MILYIPTRGPEVDELIHEFERFINDFGESIDNGNLTTLLDSTELIRIKTIKISVLYSSELDGNMHPEIVSVKHLFHYPSTTYIEDYVKIEVTHLPNMYSSEMAEFESNSILCKLSLILSLTYSTKIDFLRGVVFSSKGDHIGNTHALLSSLDNVHKHAMDMKWPRIPALALDETIQWFTSSGIHPDARSKNTIHRAINAWSYQFTHLHERETSILFWTMLGIEALMANGSNNISVQIQAKTSILFGEPKEYSKKLSKLYNYRSRLVHGELNFVAKFSLDLEKPFMEYSDYLDFASSILLALIRTLIKSDKQEFTFQYSLRE